MREPVRPDGPPPHPSDADVAVQQAEAVLAAAVDDVLTPHPRECLLCYLKRMLDSFGCDTHLRFGRHFRDLRAPRAFALEKRLGRMGGYCDCEVFLNGYRLSRQFLVPARVEHHDGVDYVVELERWPDSLPSCTGVRRGSTQPCILWERQRAWDYW